MGLHGTVGVPAAAGAPLTAVPAALPGACVSLSQYAQMTHWDEDEFWGVYDGEAPGKGCGRVLPGYWRDTVALYLAEAQQEIESVVGYHLCRTWVEDEERPYTFPLHTDWGHVVSGGVRAEDEVDYDAPVDYGVEPAMIGPIVTPLTDETEIHVFYPGSDREIQAQTVEIASGSLKIWIPRSRMVKPEFMDNDENGVDYNVTTNFLTAVDVKRVYNSAATHATLVWPTICGCGSLTCPTCSESTQDACIYVKRRKLGTVHVLPGRYSGGSWSAASFRCGSKPEIVRLNYLAGLASTDAQLANAVIRLAHSKMPEEPCGCDLLTRVWRRDQEEPERTTRERVNCKFGPTDGAWVAYQFALARKLHRARGRYR